MAPYFRAETIHRHAYWTTKLPLAAADCPPFGKERAAAVKFLDAVVAHFRHINVAGTICLDAIGAYELPVAAA